MEESPEPTTLAQRIAALKLSQVGVQSGNGPQQSQHQIVQNGSERPPPQLPSRPIERHNTSSVPILGSARNTIGNLPDEQPTPNSVDRGRKAPPVLPPRRPTESPKPQLPPRRPSESPSLSSQKFSDYNPSRRDSTESTISARSSISTFSSNAITSDRNPGQHIVKAPSYDPTTLPKLPPRRPSEEPMRAALKPSKSTGNVPQAKPAERSFERPPLPALPSRDNTQRQVEPSKPKKSALSMGFGVQTSTPSPTPPTRPTSVPTSNGTPPPIPTASRPDLSALLASKPKFTATSTPTNGTTAPPTTTDCLTCRNFTTVDTHAAQFPRASLSSPSLSDLAHNLTYPFPSLTDKARAIFTWLHHNIDYNTTAFFANAVRPSTPASTLATGLAVCEGYAALFAALATHAGLECLVLGGASKGYGYTPLAPGEPLPEFKSTHAWNVVKIDNDVWKLIDSTWGSGALGADKKYHRELNTSWFCMPNEWFGERHYPSDGRSFYRADRRAPSWEEYLTCDLGGTPMVWGGYFAEEGMEARSLEPATKEVSLSAQMAKPWVRFSFGKVCVHWDRLVNGRGEYLLYYIVVRGEKKVPLQTNGLVWWVDVRPGELGNVGDKIKISAFTNFDGKDARGLTSEEFQRKDGRVGASFSGVVEWTLVA